MRQIASETLTPGTEAENLDLSGFAPTGLNCPTEAVIGVKGTGSINYDSKEGAVDVISSSVGQNVAAGGYITLKSEHELRHFAYIKSSGAPTLFVQYFAL